MTRPQDLESRTNPHRRMRRCSAWATNPPSAGVSSSLAYRQHGGPDPGPHWWHALLPLVTNRHSPKDVPVQCVWETGPPSTHEGRSLLWAGQASPN